MSILIDPSSQVTCQGFTGKNGTFHSAQAIADGTKMGGGVATGKGSAEHPGLAILDSAREATGAALAGRLLRLVLLATGLAAAGPVAAFTGADLLSDVCLATFPRFDDAPDRVAAFHGHAITYDGRLFEQIDADRRLTWTVNEDPDSTPHRFLVDVAWGTLNSLPAASCLVADKKGFALAELKDKLSIKQLRVRPEKVLYTTVADAIVERADGRRLWLTLMLASGHEYPETGSAISVAMLMSPEYLNGLMEKAQ